MRRAVIALVLLATAVALSCAGQAKVPDYRAIDARKDEISDYWMQIRNWRAEIGLDGVEPEFHLIKRYAHVSIHSLKKELALMCEQPAEPAKQCRDICSIADAICENAEAICRIADELRTDTWANQKCASAKASCKEAKQRCCGCEEANREAPPAESDPAE